MFLAVLAGNAVSCLFNYCTATFFVVFLPLLQSTSNFFFSYCNFFFNYCNFFFRMLYSILLDIFDIPVVYSGFLPDFLPVFGWNQFLGSQKHSRRFHNHKRCETKLHVEWKWRSTWHFLTQQNSLIMPKINLNLLRKLASLVTEVNSRWFLALKKKFASLKKILTFYASSIQQISN